jgi:membrane-bound lytic murein transglycosylase D
LKFGHAEAAARAGALLLLLGRGALPAVAQQAPALAVPAQVQVGPRRVEALLAAAEKAVAEGRRPEATEKLEETSALIAGWSAEMLRNPESLVLLDRIRNLELALQGPQAKPEPGLKVEEEVIALSGEDLRAQAERVQRAEAGATFDFPIDLNDTVVTWVREFTTTRKGFIERSLARSTRYMPMVRQIFAEEGVPTDLGYLAVIESGFLNHARSYAAAVGMWQFIRSTGRIYGLKGSAWVEERRDPVKSARASARYLRRLYELSGDWYLALVGYNAGPLTTERAVANVGSRNFWDLARSRWLRNQTKNYVPEILAAILIGKNPERYGLVVVPEPPYAYETVQVDKMTSLAVLAKTARVPVEDLKDLNPELLRGSTPPGAYALRVPPGFGAPTARALAGLTPAQRLDFKTYTVRKGEVLAQVAARFEVSPEDLLAANDLKPAQFKTGTHIKVPPRSSLPIAAQDLRGRDDPKPLPERPLELLPAFPPAGPAAPVTPDPPGSSSEKIAVPLPRAAAKPGAVLQPAGPPETPASIAAAPTPVAAIIPRYVVADAGDNLARIGAAHGFPLADLKRLNPGLGEHLSKGDRVRLPEERFAVNSRATSKQPPVHKVKKGDTLAALSRRYGLDAADLKAWNHLPSSKLKPGQRLRLSPP